jgi:hypothetical protein
MAQQVEEPIALLSLDHSLELLILENGTYKRSVLEELHMSLRIF